MSILWVSKAVPYRSIVQWFPISISCLHIRPGHSSIGYLSIIHCLWLCERSRKPSLTYGGSTSGSYWYTFPRFMYSQLPENRPGILLICSVNQTYDNKCHMLYIYHTDAYVTCPTRVITNTIVIQQWYPDEIRTTRSYLWMCLPVWWARMVPQQKRPSSVVPSSLRL